jgi:hypothetical protein
VRYDRLYKSEGRKNMWGRFLVFHAAVVLVCGDFLAGCSQAPQEPAPVFMLPASKVVGGPTIKGEASAPPLGQATTRQLRYVAVPPGQTVRGMTHARVVLKQTKVATHPHRTKTVVRTKDVGAVAAQKQQSEVAAKSPGADVPAMIPLDEPAITDGASPTAKP